MNEQDKLVQVFSGSVVEVELLKNQLEDIGIESMLKDEFQEGAHAGFGAGIPGVVDLYVFEKDVVQALAFIEKEHEE
ncbi:DUF2007 domain-containing protein [Prolixibacteraceae bacterium JC049]|nr:DUF2007 domain-containing protein [Prolixibacteraceae bacterium JC049]